jgi:hypothetical protein
MKIIAKTSSALLLCLFAAVLPASVTAQSKSAPMPPNLEVIEDVPDTGITIAKPEGSKNKTTETRVNGKVTEIQVQSGKSKYVVKPDQEVGNAPRGTVQGDANRAAQWKIFEFGGPKEGKAVEHVDTLAPAPEPLKPAAAASSAASTPTKK